MRFLWFHLMPYTDLPPDFKQKHNSVWVDVDPKLFFSFLDPIFPAYSQGVYAHDDEPLAKALERKFDWVIEKCELGPGKTVLEIGPGWGAFAGHALQSGVRFTGITNSAVLPQGQACQFRRPLRHCANRLLRLRA